MSHPGRDKVWLDFDPYINAQMNAATIRLGGEQARADRVCVPVYVSCRVPGHETLRATVQLRRSGRAWKIADFLYPASDGMKAWGLKAWLQTGLKRTSSGSR